MEQRIVVTPTAVQREVEIAPGTVNTEERDVESFLRELGKRTPLETGILPPGVISIRQAGDHLQIVHQTNPGINYINWGKYERDASAKTYTLAQPYRVVVGDFVGGNLLGCRMFYSPVPITSLDQPLYHQNVPNINCKGYGHGYKSAHGGNGVGWVCLYHRESWQTMDIAQKTVRMVERCSGVETYNDRNMSETDGTRFYQERQKPDYTWNPSKWEKKSEKEGFEWTLDPELWIPVLVKNQDLQDKHYDGGVPLTLRMAMEGHASAYYGDSYVPKPVNALARSDQKLDSAAIHQKVYTEAFVNAKPIKGMSAPVKKAAPKAAPAPKPKLAVKKAAKKVGPQPGIAKKLGVTVAAAPAQVNCTACGIETPNKWFFITKKGKEAHYFCKEHYEYITPCVSCDLLYQIQDTMNTVDGEPICMSCAQNSLCLNCGKVFNWTEGQVKYCKHCLKNLAAAAAKPANDVF